ncbi:MAG: amidohydrolase [Cryomorphaceae bacterium]|nr:amidohydrolase [Cryomorphaceae bacterium]
MRSTKLGISALQFAIHWENKSENLKTIARFLESMPVDTDLVVLPEMFSTGFSMQPENHAEKMDGFSVNWLKNMAARYGVYICGSLIISESESFYNRFILVDPNGAFSQYDKRHLFSMAGEEKKYAPGNQRLIWEVKGWKILPQVCYDLRFPVWSRNDLNYDLAIYPANWPERRDYPWKTLLRARAIENQCYVVGVNRVGDDGNGVAHNGCSAIIDPLGADLHAAEPNMEQWIYANLESATLEKIRKSFPFLSDRDDFRLL